MPTQSKFASTGAKPKPSRYSSIPESPKFKLQPGAQPAHLIERRDLHDWGCHFVQFYSLPRMTIAGAFVFTQLAYPFMRRALAILQDRLRKMDQDFHPKMIYFAQLDDLSRLNQTRKLKFFATLVENLSWTCLKNLEESCLRVLEEDHTLCADFREHSSFKSIIYEEAIQTFLSQSLVILEGIEVKEVVPNLIALTVDQACLQICYEMDRLAHLSKDRVQPKMELDFLTSPWSFTSWIKPLAELAPVLLANEQYNPSIDCFQVTLPFFGPKILLLAFVYGQLLSPASCLYCSYIAFFSA